MVLAPNLFSCHHHGNKQSIAKQREEMEEAVGGAHLIQLMITHQDLLWTVSLTTVSVTSLSQLSVATLPFFCNRYQGSCCLRWDRWTRQPIRNSSASPRQPNDFWGGRTTRTTGTRWDTDPGETVCALTSSVTSRVCAGNGAVWRCDQGSCPFTHQGFHGDTTWRTN